MLFAGPASQMKVICKSPKVGDIVIQHNAKTRIANHAAIIVDIKGGEYYVNHAIKTKYIKYAKLKNKARLTFYRFN